MDIIGDARTASLNHLRLRRELHATRCLRLVPATNTVMCIERPWFALGTCDSVVQWISLLMLVLYPYKRVVYLVSCGCVHRVSMVD